MCCSKGQQIDYVSAGGDLRQVFPPPLTATHPSLRFLPRLAMAREGNGIACIEPQPTKAVVASLDSNTYVRIIFFMPKRSLRDDIIDAGLRVMFRQGYNGSSVRDIVAEAGAPQGSFTNHFRSKEAFAEAVLDRYFEYLKGLVQQALGDEALS